MTRRSTFHLERVGIVRAYREMEGAEEHGKERHRLVKSHNAKRGP